MKEDLATRINLHSERILIVVPVLLYLVGDSKLAGDYLSGGYYYSSSMR
jgi:hypothetical protein